MPKVFTRTVEVPNPAHASIHFKWKAVKIIIGVFILICLSFLAIQGFTFGKAVVERWDEIKFAYEKPTIVDSVKKDYELKQSKLEQSYVKPDNSEEDKLVDKVLKKLQAEESK